MDGSGADLLPRCFQCSSFVGRCNLQREMNESDVIFSSYRFLIHGVASYDLEINENSGSFSRIHFLSHGATLCDLEMKENSDFFLLFPVPESRVQAPMTSR